MRKDGKFDKFCREQLLKHMASTDELRHEIKELKSQNASPETLEAAKGAFSRAQSKRIRAALFTTDMGCPSCYIETGAFNPMGSDATKCTTCGTIYP